MKRIFAVILLALALPVALQAQSEIRVQVPNVVASDEKFNLTFIVEGEERMSGFSWDVPDGLQLVWGPQKGTSQSVSIVNGKRSASFQTTYTYVLMPARTGVVTIPSATAVVGGKQLTSASRSIEVVSGGGSQQAEPSRGNQAAATGTVSREDVFLRLLLSKGTVVMGEPLTATLKLYQRADIAGFEDAKFPSFNGFWSKELQAPSNIEFQRENVGDRIYNTAVIRSYQLTPQKAGDIVIDPAELVCLINVRKARTYTGSIFDDFFQDDYSTIRKRVTTPAVTVHVKALPSGAPSSFTGAVGSFRMKASLDRDSLSVHDAASLVVTVSGKGNLGLVDAPSVTFPPDFEPYDVKTTDASGSRTFEYPFIPRSAGNFELDPVEFTYYDLQAQKYVTLVSDPLVIKVAKAAGDAQTSSETYVPGVVQERVRDKAHDIRYISTRMPDLKKKGEFFVGSSMFWLLLLGMFIAAVAMDLILKTMASRRADVAGSKSRAASKMARKRLSTAGDYLSKDLSTAFYEELHKALLGFVSDKMAMDASDMSKENIAARMCSSGVSEADASRFTALIDACEFARYAPAAGHDAMAEHYQEAVSVITKVNSSMKNLRKHIPGAAASVIVALLLVPSAMQAREADSLWVSGVDAYSEGRWADAASAWESILETGCESPELHCNLGDASFRQGEYGKAVLSYERALKLNPAYDDARVNLEYVSTLIKDRIEPVPEFFLKVWLRGFGHKLPSDLWTVLFFVLLAAALAMAVLFLRSGSSAARKTGFFTGVACLLLSLACLAFASAQKSEYMSGDSAVVMSAVAPVKSAPGGRDAKDLFPLHEGTRVTVLDTDGDWSKIGISDGRQGWIGSKDIEMI